MKKSRSLLLALSLLVLLFAGLSLYALADGSDAVLGHGFCVRQHSGGRLMEEHDTLYTVAIFIVSYLMLILVGSLIGTLFGLDLMTAFTGAVACIGNVGPGFGEVGSMDNFAAMPSVMKGVDSLLMLFGRLEIFGLLQLFMMKWWK